MEFTVQSGKLAEKTAALARLVASHPIVPILDNFLFEIKENKLTITASDQHTTVVTHLPVKAKEDLSLAVPARILLDTLKHLPDQELRFNVHSESYGLSIQSATGQYKLACENATDFPNLPRLSEEASQTSFPIQKFCNALEQVLFCVSKNNLHLALGGVHIRMTPKGTTFVATDGNRLVRCTTDQVTGTSIAPVTLPGKSLEHLLKLFSNQKGTCTFFLDQDNVSFQTENFYLSTQLIPEEYPNYENVIPQKNPYKLETSTKELLHALRIISIYANRSTHQVRLRPAKKALYILTEDLNFSNEAKEELSCVYNGEEQEVAFNVKLLTEMLQKINTDRVQFIIDNDKKPVLIFPDEQKKDSELLFLIMPVLYLPSGEASA